MAQHRNPFVIIEKNQHQTRILVASMYLLAASLTANAAAPLDSTLRANKPPISHSAAIMLALEKTPPKPVIQVTTPKPVIQATTPKPQPTLHHETPKVGGTVTVGQQKPQTNLNVKNRSWCEDDCAPSSAQTKVQNGQAR